MKLRILALTFALLAATIILSPSAECTGCNQATKDFCTARSTEAFTDCINLTYHDLPYCLLEQERAYDTCMLLMGCPQPP
jgi:hypothetical protein